MSSPDNTPIPEGYKRCCKCRQCLRRSEFHKNRSRKDGLHSACKACTKIKTAQYHDSHYVRHPRRIYKVDSRQCSKCKNWLPHSEFTKARRNKDGLSNRCKSCVAKASVADRAKYHDERLAHAREYRANHREIYRNARRNYETVHPDYHREYRKRNPHVAKLGKLRRRTRELSLPFDFNHEDEIRMLNYFNGCCAVCGQTASFWHKIAYDHWIPLSSPNCPGTVANNMVPLCHATTTGLGKSCNRNKSHRDPHEWLVSEFGERKARKIEQRIQAYFDSLKEQSK